MSNTYDNSNTFLNNKTEGITGATIIGTTYSVCGICGASISMYQNHQCYPNQLTFPGMIQLEDHVEALEIALQDLKSRSHNRQDEEVHVRAEDGHQSADEEGSRRDASARERKGNWYWPSKS